MNDIAICTIITKSYLAHAKSLSESIKKYHPNIPIYVLLADKIEQNYFNPQEESFNWIYLSDLSNQEAIKQMSFYYNPFEFCCALRGFLHEYIYTKTKVKRWLFLDSDIMITHSLETIFEQLNNYDILLNPHSKTPIKEEQYIDPHEISLLVCGCYNGGFLGLTKTENTYNFINWLKRRLIEFSFNDRDRANPRALYVDQLWLNLVPFYFQKVGLLDHPGANLGHWNLFEKCLIKTENDQILVDEKPLLFAHFSGLDLNDLTKVSIHNPIYNNKVYPIWQELAEKYKSLLYKNGYEKIINYPFAFSHFNSGEKILINHRQCYYDYLKKGDNNNSSPFKSLQDFKSNFGFNKNYQNKSDLVKELEEITQQLYLSQERIKAMETSKFWLLRKTWFKIKKLLSLGKNE